jgi:hypothetical protein
MDQDQTRLDGLEHGLNSPEQRPERLALRPLAACPPLVHIPEEAA